MYALGDEITPFVQSIFLNIAGTGNGWAGKRIVTDNRSISAPNEGDLILATMLVVGGDVLSFPQFKEGLELPQALEKLRD